MTSRFGLSVWLTLFAALASAAEPEVDPKNLPRVAPTEPAAALATIRARPGFRAELAAAEPVVVDPVAMSFDEDGRLYVVEMRDYSERRPEKLGRIRRLEDSAGNGQYDRSTAYLEGLPWPTAVVCFGGGIFVGATPDIFFCRDTNGDGVADVREPIFTGFASDYAPFATNKLNVQALFNSFQWGPDNRIHGATSLSGGQVRLVDSPFVRAWIRRSGADPDAALAAPRLDLRGHDFSFDPRSLELRSEGGGGQHGMSFDLRGRKFICSNSDHIQYLAYSERVLANYPSLPNPRVSIAVDGPAAEVYRISPDEPWRVIRTAWRVAGQVPGPIEGGGRPSGYFTGATGITIYRGDAYGEDYSGDAFVADCGSNLVHRKKLRPDGVVLKAERAADERASEFLESTDNWFRPVQMANGPDGCLYIADMYREVIEHPWSLPQSIKKHLDLNSGNDRGRIYRIVPERFSRPQTPRLSAASTAELVPLLSHSDGWHRETAARLLYERQDKTAIEPMAAALSTATFTNRSKPVAASIARQILSTLEGLGALDGTQVLSASRAVGPSVLIDACQPGRVWTNRGLVENELARAVTGEKGGARLEESDDLSLFLAIGGMPPRLKLDLFSAVLQERFSRCQLRPDDTETLRRDLRVWLLPACAQALGEDAPALFHRFTEQWASGAGRLSSENASEVLSAIARLIGMRNRSNEVAQIIESADRFPALPTAVGVLTGLEEGLTAGGGSWDSWKIAERIPQRFKTARAELIAAGQGMIGGDTVSAIHLFRLAPEPALRTNLVALVASASAAAPVRMAALEALVRASSPELPAELLGVWRQLTPALRAPALAALLTKADRIRPLLEAMRQEEVRVTELSASQIEFLRASRDPEIRRQAGQVLGDPPRSSRTEVVAQFQGALALAGDARRGDTTYRARCASCHRAGSQGHPLGPDLVSVKSSGKEKLLINILDPSREVAPNYFSYLLETKDGESFAGVIIYENANGVTLRLPEGKELGMARSKIARLQSQGKSLMPEGLEAGWTEQDLADLMAFILSL